MFSITVQGSKTLLASFPNKYNVKFVPVAGANGRIYAAEESGPNPANIFSVTSAAGSAQIYQPQGFAPFLLQNLPDGNLLGIGTRLSNNLSDLITSDLKGNIASIYEFPSTQRLLITATYANDGNYYGIVATTSDTSGNVYRLTPSGSLTNIASFPSGTFSYGFNSAPLLQASDGNLYGATETGGANGTGTIYKVTLGGQYTLLYTFPNDYNSYPMALIEGSDGNLYGATAGNIGLGGYSQLFRITKAGKYTLVYAMKNLTADGACGCWLTQGSDGTIYGSASGGGTYGGGLFFALNAGLAKPAPRPLTFKPKSGAVGTKVLIWGSNLLSASVQFNGTPATVVTNGGSNYVTATVPAFATTGPITLTTPGGTATTHGNFTVQ